MYLTDDPVNAARLTAGLIEWAPHLHGATFREGTLPLEPVPVPERGPAYIPAGLNVVDPYGRRGRVAGVAYLDGTVHYVVHGEGGDHVGEWAVRRDVLEQYNREAVPTGNPVIDTARELRRYLDTWTDATLPRCCWASLHKAEQGEAAGWQHLLTHLRWQPTDLPEGAAILQRARAALAGAA